MYVVLRGEALKKVVSPKVAEEKRSGRLEVVMAETDRAHACLQIQTSELRQANTVAHDINSNDTQREKYSQTHAVYIT